MRMTKPTKWCVRPAKTRISLGIHPVWSESSLCAQWVAKDPRFSHADSEDWSDWVDIQADMRLCWAHSHFVGFDMRGLILKNLFAQAVLTNNWGDFIFYYLLLLLHIANALLAKENGVFAGVDCFHVEILKHRHDKTNKMSVRPAKTQISLGIRQVWSESSLSAWRKLGSLATRWAHSKDSDQIGPMPRLIWVFAGRTVILLVLSCRGSHCKRGHKRKFVFL